MSLPLDVSQRAKAVRFLLLNWEPDRVAREIPCSIDTIYRMRRNLMIYGSPLPPYRRQKGAPRKFTVAVEQLQLRMFERGQNDILEIDSRVE
jgi:hypothetical protein